MIVCKVYLLHRIVIAPIGIRHILAVGVTETKSNIVRTTPEFQSALDIGFSCIFAHGSLIIVVREKVVNVLISVIEEITLNIYLIAVVYTITTIGIAAIRFKSLFILAMSIITLRVIDEIGRLSGVTIVITTESHRKPLGRIPTERETL